MTPALAVQVKGLSMAFRLADGTDLPVLDRVDLEVAPGKCLGVVGPSGCGKTTLLKLLGGLLTATAGQTLVHGEDAAAARSRRVHSFMFQRTVLLPWLTVAQNVALPARIACDPGSEARVGQLVQLVGLQGFGGAYPEQLSGGMQARAALARALLLRPRLLLMDEPFASLDALTRSRLHGEFARIVADLGTTVVLVTHAIEEAVLLADCVVVLSGRPARVVEQVEVDLPPPAARDRGTCTTSAFIDARCRIERLLFASPTPAAVA